MSTQLTVDIPDELASELRPLHNELGEILELGLKQWRVRNGGTFEGLADVMETLARLPGPQEVLALRPSEPLQARIASLLDKNRTTGLSAEEEHQWQQYEFVEHLVRIAKTKAALKLKHAGDADEPDVRSG